VLLGGAFLASGLTILAFHQARYGKQESMHLGSHVYGVRGRSGWQRRWTQPSTARNLRNLRDFIVEKVMSENPGQSLVLLGRFRWQVRRDLYALGPVGGPIDVIFSLYSLLGSVPS
jgi:hypothetical protein